MQIQLDLPAPHLAQKRIKSEARRFNVVNCGRRWGKSTLGVDLIIETTLAGSPCAWFADKFASLDQPWRDLKHILAPVTKEKNETLRRIELLTGGSVKMWSLEDPECSRGPAYKRIVIDEAAKVRKLLPAWQAAIRANLADYQGDAWFFSTPRGRNDFFKLFELGLNPDRSDWACWQMPTGANPHISPDEIMAMRLEMGARIASQEIDAQFLDAEGRFFDEWDEDQHTELFTFSPGEQPSYWSYFAGLDWGYGSPFAFLLCSIDTDGVVRVLGEIHESRLTTTEQAGKVLALLNTWGLDRKDVMVFADPSMFHSAKRADLVGEADIEAFYRAGLQCVQANNNRAQGWSTLREWMHKPNCFKVSQGHCSKLIDLFPLMTYDERLGHENDMDSSGDDHLHDALRYALHSRRRAAEKPAEVEPVDPLLAYARHRDRRYLLAQRH